MKYENRADLLIAAGESIKMQEGAGIEPMQKYNGKIIPIIYAGDFNLGQSLHKNEFPIAVVEGKAVFVGDVLWNVPNNFKFTVARADDINCKPCLWNAGVGSIGGWISDMSWNPPKPKTVMVELLREDAELWSGMEDISNWHVQSKNLYTACRKALEQK